MIAVDTNILIYAHRAEASFHRNAARCLKNLAEGIAPWAIPWPCVHEFLAVVTNPRIFVPPTPLEAALDQVEAWFKSPSLVLLAETEQHWASIRALVAAGRVVGARIHDARIAALCVQHGVRELWSADRDFSRFSSLKVINPLTR